MAKTTLDFKIETAHLSQVIDEVADLIYRVGGDVADEYQARVDVMIENGDLYRASDCEDMVINIEPTETLLALVDELRSSGAE